MPFHDFCKTWETVRNTGILSISKTHSKNLINPEEFLPFWTQFRKMHPKMIKKPLGFSLLAAWDCAWSENLINPVEN